MKKTALDRFKSKITITPSCWIWEGYKNKDGYGRFSVSKRMTFAHRFSYEEYVGSAPPDLCVCHRCDNPECVNPSHLFLGTNAENSKDMVLKNRSGKGEKSPVAKLSRKQVDDIRSMYKKYTKGRTAREIALEYGISRRHVADIVLGRYWAD